ncbi:hypothetical protein Emag_000971 [Eimeria magna]
MAGKVDKTKKLEPVPKPDEKLYRDRIQAETTAIEELKAKINDLQQRISAVIGGREEYNMEKQNRQSRLDALQKQIDELEEKRKVLFEKIQQKQKEGADLKQSATDLRRKIGFSSVEDIDQKVAALEHSMMTSTLSLKEEKALLEEIKRLKNSKPLLSKYQALEQSANSLEDTSVVPLRAMLDDVRTKLLELRTLKREESMKYKELLEKSLRKVTAGCTGYDFIDRREVQAELSREMQKYQVYLQQVRRERGLKMKEERERRNLENERLQLMRDLERVESELPYEAECLLLAQTIQYLQKIIEEPSSVSEKDKEEADAENSGLAGALLPKSQRKEVFFYAPKHKGKQGKENEKKKEKSKMLKYDVGTLAYFEQCGVTAPVTIDDVPGCLEKLETKLQNFKELQYESSRKVDERKAEIMVKIQAVDAKVAALDKKEKMMMESKQDELAEDSSPTADDGDDE